MFFFVLAFLLKKSESLDNAILEPCYMSHYTMLSKYGNCTRLLKIGCFYK